MINELTGRVMRAERKGSKKILTIVSVTADNAPIMGSCSINALSMMEILKVGDCFRMMGNVEEYSFSKKRINANKFHTNKENELKVLDILALTINGKQEVTLAGYKRMLEDEALEEEKIAVPKLEDEEKD